MPHFITFSRLKITSPGKILFPSPTSYDTPLAPSRSEPRESLPNCTGESVYRLCKTVEPLQEGQGEACTLAPSLQRNMQTVRDLWDSVLTGMARVYEHFSFPEGGPEYGTAGTQGFRPLWGIFSHFPINPGVAPSEAAWNAGAQMVSLKIYAEKKFKKIIK